eukprot:Sspe_Gene.72827::Locus_43639_Transcript_1_1_Confidence_1.000_Length_3898::g.72827::m.72827
MVCDVVRSARHAMSRLRRCRDEWRSCPSHLRAETKASMVLRVRRIAKDIERHVSVASFTHKEVVEALRTLAVLRVDDPFLVPQLVQRVCIMLPGMSPQQAADCFVNATTLRGVDSKHRLLTFTASLASDGRFLGLPVQEQATLAHSFALLRAAYPEIADLVRQIPRSDTSLLVTTVWSAARAAVRFPTAVPDIEAAFCSTSGMPCQVRDVCMVIESLVALSHKTSIVVRRCADHAPLLAKELVETKRGDMLARVLQAFVTTRFTSPMHQAFRSLLPTVPELLPTVRPANLPAVSYALHLANESPEKARAVLLLARRVAKPEVVHMLNLEGIAGVLYSMGGTLSSAAKGRLQSRAVALLHANKALLDKMHLRRVLDLFTQGITNLKLLEALVAAVPATYHRMKARDYAHIVSTFVAAKIRPSGVLSHITSAITTQKHSDANAVASVVFELHRLSCRAEVKKVLPAVTWEVLLSVRSLGGAEVAKLTSVFATYRVLGSEVMGQLLRHAAGLELRPSELLTVVYTLGSLNGLFTDGLSLLAQQAVHPKVLADLGPDSSHRLLTGFERARVAVPLLSTYVHRHKKPADECDSPGLPAGF